MATAVQRRQPTCSFKNGTDSAVIISGAAKLNEMAVASGKALKARNINAMEETPSKQRSKCPKGRCVRNVLYALFRSRNGNSGKNAMALRKNSTCGMEYVCIMYLTMPSMIMKPPIDTVIQNMPAAVGASGSSAASAIAGFRRVGLDSGLIAEIYIDANAHLTRDSHPVVICA